MKSIKKSFIMLALATALAGATGCSDDNGLTPLVTTNGGLDNATFSSLTFKWEKVAGATQYSCQLSKSGSDDVIATEMTQSASITFTGLEPATDYTLTILAYAPMQSDFTTSEPITITARTADVIAVATPEVTMSREVNSLIFSWNYIADAKNYYYEWLDGDGNVIAQDYTGALSVTFSALQSGTYTFRLYATIDADGYRDSDPAELTVDFERQREEIWRANGIYTSSVTGSGHSAQMIAYDDNSYTIEAWYGVSGHDFTFTVDPENAENMFAISQELYDYDSATGAYSVPTGLTSPETVEVYPAGNECSFEGSAGAGNVKLKVSVNGSEPSLDEFMWGLEIDDICGVWVMHTKCMADMEDYDEDYDNTQTITITKIDDNTIEFPAPYYSSVMLRATVDTATAQLTIEPADGFGSYGYTFAGWESATTPVTAIVSPTRFTLTDWTYWLYYDGWWQYTQGSGTVEFTRQ